MDESTEEKKPRKKPGAPFFLVAMTFYLLLVHGTSLLGAGAGGLDVPGQQYPDTWPWINSLLNTLGATALSSAVWGMLLLYGCMVCIFLLTRLLVPGPIWLGSLAGTFVMAHPVKTEILFSPTGLYYALATFLALAATLFYARQRILGSNRAYGVSVILFAAAVLPFSVNGALLVALFMIELFLGDPDTRNWLKLLPMALIAAAGGWFHIETLYADIAPLSAMYAPLLLVLYPIGLLPATVASMAASPLEAWFWAVVLVGLLALVLWKVPSNPFRCMVLALLCFRFFPGAFEVDMTTLDGGGQLFYPLALMGIALAALSAWCMRFEAWGQPVVALTTILCVVLFVLQFQANRAYLHRVKNDGINFERLQLGPFRESRRPLDSIEKCNTSWAAPNLPSRIPVEAVQWHT